MQSFRTHCEYIVSRKVYHLAHRVDLPAIRRQFLDYISPTNQMNQLFEVQKKVR